MAGLLNSLLVGVGGSPASAAEATTAVAVADVAFVPETHVAGAGDSLWSIADRYRGSVDRDRYVDALIELNGSTAIVVGQAVQLP